MACTLIDHKNDVKMWNHEPQAQKKKSSALRASVRSKNKGGGEGLVDSASIILSIIQQNERCFKLVFQFSTAGIIRAFMR